MESTVRMLANRLKDYSRVIIVTKSQLVEPYKENFKDDKGNCHRKWRNQDILILLRYSNDKAKAV